MAEARLEGLQASLGVDGEVEKLDGDSSESSEGEEVTIEQVLAQVLAECYGDPELQHRIQVYVPAAPTELDPCTIFRLLVGTMSVLWFDIFNALGVDHATLMDLKKQYPTSPQVCLYKAILVWVEGTVPKPSWKALADVLNFKMLESDLAKSIALQHYSEEERAEEEAYLKGVPRGIIPPQFDEDEEEFTDLISSISKELGNDSVAEVYFYLKQLQNASGWKYLDQSFFPETLSTIDALLVPLMDLNLISSQDVDLLITVIMGIGRQDLVPMVEKYCSKATLCHPVFKAIKDTVHFFSLRLDLDPDVCMDLDLQTVSLVKRDVCHNLGIERTPYLLQFIGWRRVPLIVQFQVHFSLVDRMLELAKDPSCPLERYVRMDMDVRGTLFNFHLNKTRTS